MSLALIDDRAAIEVVMCFYEFAGALMTCELLNGKNANILGWISVNVGYLEGF